MKAILNETPPVEAVANRLSPAIWRCLGVAAILAIACILPFAISGYHVSQFSQVLIYAIAMLGLNILTGSNGQISLGHGAFYAIGAYTTAVLLDKTGVPYWATVPIAGAICLGTGFLFGLPALRLAIRKVHDLDWKPLFFMTYTSTSIASVINPAGPQNAIGLISAGFVKDQADPDSKNDTGMNEWRDFMAKYMPGADATDGNYVFAYSISKAMLQVLKQCEGNFTRENIMKQAANLHNLELPTLLPGIRVNTSPTNYHPIRQLQFGKFDGTHWVPLGDLVTGADN